MARRPSRRARPTAPRPAPTGPSGGTVRERIIAAFLALLAERSFEDIGFAEIARRAGATLADARGEFTSTLGILAAHVKAIDRQVLSGSDPDVEEETPRERLFDVLMRRLDALAPHKEAVRSLMRSVRRNPPLALALNGIAVRSMQWMLTAADIDAAGPRGLIRAQGLAVLFASVLRVWIDDEEEGIGRTMATLDRELGRGQRWVGLLDELCRFFPPRCPRLRRRSRRDDRDYGDYDDDRDAPPVRA